MKLNENIKRLRKENGFTQEEIGNRISVSKQTVQRYESGEIPNVPYEKIELLAKIFGCSRASLMGWEDESEKEYFRREISIGAEEAKIIKTYSQLTHGHKKAVRHLMENLLECQEKYNSNK
ncbi:MAG: helix-turn-helix domain-containing protein [Clostridiales bacterium]|nr:helix-turn-helix domain-containing protein [Clostridiales bacterium]